MIESMRFSQSLFLNVLLIAKNTETLTNKTKEYLQNSTYIILYIFILYTFLGKVPIHVQTCLNFSFRLRLEVV